MIRAVVFDLDDTLISERAYIESGFRHISKRLCRELSRNEDEVYAELSALFAENPKQVFNRLLKHFGQGFTNATIAELVEEYRNHAPDISFYRDVGPCLENLREQGIKTGIITDGYSAAQRQKLAAIRACEHFDEIMMTDELGRAYWKPHAKAFEWMRERLNVDYSEMAYVGDNPEKDFFIGSVLPITTIRIHRSGVYRDRDYLANVREHHSIRYLHELPDILGLSSDRALK